MSTQTDSTSARRDIDGNPPLAKLIQAGLPLKGHEEFKKADIETRQKLYVAIAKQVWNPDRLNAVAS
jgi:hypothetical protein